MRGDRSVFDGWIAGLGTASGTRLVIGHWPRSPFGPISDVMVETADARRRLFAPTREVADFIAATYAFDDVEIVDVRVEPGPSGWAVAAGPLEARFTVGRRGLLGALLRAVPPPLARQPAWVALLDLPARLVISGVRTRGSAGGGRREWYGVRDLHPITGVDARMGGVDLGALARVVPPVRFGFGSVPPRPALVRVTTTVELPAS